MKILLFFTGFLLPWHGAITVFLPDEFRWWKEVFLVIFFTLALAREIKNFRTGKKIGISTAEIVAIAFLAWLAILVAIGGFQQDQIVAARYLGLGFFTFLVFSRLHRGNFDSEIFKKFAVGLVSSGVFSVFFGIWAKFFGGFEILRNFYSTAISSWVPGQKIPIFHEIDGVSRMQGGSSGPIEFSHLLVIAIFAVAFLPIARKFKFILVAILAVGVAQSASRAAIVAVMLLGIFAWIFSKIKKSNLKIANFSKKIVEIFTPKKLAIATFASIFIFALILPKILDRTGDSDHFSRPLVAIRAGFDRPIFGNLGSFGPAARIRNLREKNDDRAPIAENVFADAFAQTGLLGLALVLAFWIAIFRSAHQKFRPFLIAIFFTANLATIFEMTPIAIAVFLTFGTSERGIENLKL